MVPLLAHACPGFQRSGPPDPSLPASLPPGTLSPVNVQSEPGTQSQSKLSKAQPILGVSHCHLPAHRQQMKSTPYDTDRLPIIGPSSCPFFRRRSTTTTSSSSSHVAASYTSWTFSSPACRHHRGVRTTQRSHGLQNCRVVLRRSGVRRSSPH